MHWIERDSEPQDLEAVRLRLTNGWVDYYRDRLGSRPTDSQWRRFIDDLQQMFSGLCAYCEENTAGEVDHFKPISRFPHLVYEWSNWVLSCPHCNRRKSNKWPSTGYVDPCTEDTKERPEHYFTFNTETQALTPKDDLPPSRRERAVLMIRDLELNNYYHLRNRHYVLSVINLALSTLNEGSDDASSLLDSIVDRASPFSSFARAVLEEHGFEIDD